MKPTFLGIGSARCGSTWLHKRLALHPDVQVSDPKSLQFFDKNILRQDLDWYWSYFDGTEDAPAKDVRGEVTPFYCRLKRRYVENIHRILPDARIILTIRNPVERIWSNAKLDFGHYKKWEIETVSEGAFLRYGARVRSQRYCDYESIIALWEDVFGADAIHVELFDEIADAPVRMLQRIFRHIGADPSWEPPHELVAPRVSPEGGDRQIRAIPEMVRWSFARDWIDRTRRLNVFLDGRVQAWVDDMEEALKTSKPGWQAKRQLNRKLLALPEKFAYFGYETLRNRKIDARWKQFLG